MTPQYLQYKISKNISQKFKYHSVYAHIPKEKRRKFDIVTQKWAKFIHNWFSHD